MVIGLLTIDTIFVQVVLLLVGSCLCCFEGGHVVLTLLVGVLLLRKVKWDYC